MKILFAQKIVGIAGSENYLLNMIPAMKRKGIEVEFLCLYPVNKEGSYNDFNAVLQSHGVKIHKVCYVKNPTIKVLKEIAQIIQSTNYDIVHSHLIHADLFLALAKLFYVRGLVLVSTKHGYEENYNNKFGFDPKHKKLNKYFITAWLAEKMMNRSFAISKGLYNLYSGLGICNKKKLDMIHYGFDFDEIKSKKNDVNQFRLAKHQLVLVGRLTGFKGHRFAFQAIAKLKNTIPDLKLIVVGSGELEEELKSMVKNLNIEQQVCFIGYHPEGRKFMYHSDIVLIPSVAEGFGVVVLEAFSVKKPIIAFDVPSLHEHIISEESGVLIEPYNTTIYANQIERLLKNSALRIKFSEKSYQKLISYYSLNRMVDETVSFYENTLSRV